MEPNVHCIQSESPFTLLSVCGGREMGDSHLCQICHIFHQRVYLQIYLHIQIPPVLLRITVAPILYIVYSASAQL